jgi:hypothetical protein
MFIDRARKLSDELESSTQRKASLELLKSWKPNLISGLIIIAI